MLTKVILAPLQGYM